MYTSDEIEYLLYVCKVTNGAHIEYLLYVCKVTNGAHIEYLLYVCKVTNGAHIEAYNGCQNTLWVFPYVLEKYFVYVLRLISVLMKCLFSR